MTGQALAHYQVLEKLGEGGMGVVYRAVDTRLNRPVAIKVLPSELSRDPVRVSRFLHEARTASALNHPNIVTVHDADTVGGVSFIAMEYVDGRTLDQLIGRKGLKLGEALKYAIQIADALAAAHAAGIVHRDLKPANVMVTAAGRVKVLDFGLAKALDDDPADAAAVTRTSDAALRPRTEAGTILGTVAYMSPEQAEGKKIDARSDVFSFGSVLYEMVTGRRAFQGESKVSTLSAILHADSTPASQIADGIPRELDRIIAHCLRKDPARRFQHFDDVKTLLEELKEEFESGTLAAPPLPARVGARTRLTAALVGVAAVGAAILAILMVRSRPPASTLPVPIRLTSDSGLTTQPAVSPDGKLFAFASDRGGGENLDVWVKQVGSTEALRLTTHEADDHEPDFSPDGQRIVFRSERDSGGIYVVPTLGGDARRIADGGHRPRFSPDGQWIAYWTGHLGGDFIASGGSAVYTVPASGGQPMAVQTNIVSTRFPVWSPDSTRLLLYGRSEWKNQATENDDWWVVPAQGGPAVKTGAFDVLRRVRMASDSNAPRYRSSLVPAAWTPDHHVLFSGAVGDSTNIWQLSIAERTYQVAGPPERLTTGTGLEMFPVQASGAGGRTRMLFTSMNENMDVWSVAFDAKDGANQGKVSGEPRRLTQDAAPDIMPGITRDGRLLVFGSSRLGNFDIWSKDLASGKETALVSTPLHEWRPTISADGSTLAYQVVENQKETIHVASHGAPARRICDADCYMPWDLSSDGALMLYWDGQQRRVGLMEVASGRRAIVLEHPEYAILRSIFSPDGRWVAFAGVDAHGGSHTFEAPLHGLHPTPDREWIPLKTGPNTANLRRTVDFDNMPHWSPDGNLIYVVSGVDGFQCFWALPLDPATKHPVRSAFPVLHLHSVRRSLGNVIVFFQEIAVARDQLVFPLNERTGNIWMIER